jgi:hypothetical protein
LLADQIGLEGQELVSALGYAGNEGWMAVHGGRTLAGERNLALSRTIGRKEPTAGVL